MSDLHEVLFAFRLPLHALRLHSACTMVYTAPLGELVAGWEALGVPVDTPGFFHHPAFIRAEQDWPDLINAYARYVRERSCTAEYLARSEAVVRAAAGVVGRAVRADGRTNLCVAASTALAALLDRAGVWNYVAVGGCSITFTVAGRAHRFAFHPFDVRPIDAAHAWVVAPPFRVIDVTLRQQRYPRTVRPYLPYRVLAVGTQPGDVAPPDLCTPALLRGLGSQASGDALLERLRPGFRTFTRVFPPEVVPAEEATLKYVPVRVVTPVAALDALNDVRIDGRTPADLFEHLRTTLDGIPKDAPGGWV